MQALITILLGLVLTSDLYGWSAQASSTPVPRPPCVLRVTVLGQEVTMEFVIPLGDLVGFDRKPQGDRENDLVDKRLADLAQTYGVVEFPRKAECSGRRSDVTPTFEKVHSGVAVKQVYFCKNIAAVNSLEMILFLKLRHLRSIQVRAETPNGNYEALLTPAWPRLSLEK